MPNNGSSLEKHPLDFSTNLYPIDFQPRDAGIHWLETELVPKLQKSSSVNSKLLGIGSDCKHVYD